MQLCEWKGVEIHEAGICPNHVHMLVSIPPKIVVSSFMGYLKGKSSLNRTAGCLCNPYFTSLSGLKMPSGWLLCCSSLFLLFAEIIRVAASFEG